MIYCVPCNVLTLLWGVCLWRDRNLSVMYLIAFWLVHIMIYLFLNHFGIWGGGDSDFLFLFANVFLFALGTANAYETAILECICLCMALLLSIVIGCIEGKIKQKIVNLKSKVAVVPGMACMIGIFLAKGMIERCYL